MAIGLATYATLQDGGYLDGAESGMIAWLLTINRMIGRSVFSATHLQFSGHRHIGGKGDGRTGI